MLSAGSKLGKYQLVRRIAVGGMAELYLARATGIEGFEKLVALKRILPQYAENEEFIRMFLDEARLAATLQHPNIAQVYDIGCANGSYFFTMEYVHGQDVLEILKACRRQSISLPLEQAISIVIGVCAGLHHAHEKRAPNGRPLGIVHRDVSPSNVLVTYDGCVKVVDFGIAKAALQEGSTRVGTLKGKISYMSPEQCRGELLDRRSDVFSIGILLYELTTGCRLFYGDNELATLNRIVTGEVVNPSVRRPGYDPDLETIVLRVLRSNRDERYPTAEDLQLALEGYAREHKLAVSPVALARFMASVFADKLDAWRQAQNAGVSLADHLTSLASESSRTGERSPVSFGTPMAPRGTPSVSGSQRSGNPLPPPIPGEEVACADTKLLGRGSQVGSTGLVAKLPFELPSNEVTSPDLQLRRKKVVLRSLVTGVVLAIAAVLAIALWPRAHGTAETGQRSGALAPGATEGVDATTLRVVPLPADDAAPAPQDAGPAPAAEPDAAAMSAPGQPDDKKPRGKTPKPRPRKQPTDKHPEWGLDSPLPPS